MRNPALRLLVRQVEVIDMKKTMTRLLATPSVLTLLLLVSDVALADRHKDESKQGRSGYDLSLIHI